MTDKEQIIIDGVDVSNCEYYKQAFTGFICTNPNKSNDCSKNPDCNFKQLARGTQERDRYRKAFEEIEKIVNIDFSLPCARTDCTYPEPCKDRLTENGTKCMHFALLKIKDIVQKNKEK